MNSRFYKKDQIYKKGILELFRTLVLLNCLGVNVFGVQVLGISTDSHFSHLAWVNQSRKQGGLGGLTYPLVSDFNKTISRDYGVLIEEAGIALR